MTAKLYRFIAEGNGANGQTWTTTCDLNCEFHDSFILGMQLSFNQLTEERAVYGKPGVGCNGPYDILRVVIQQIVPGINDPHIDPNTGNDVQEA